MDNLNACKEKQSRSAGVKNHHTYPVRIFAILERLDVSRLTNNLADPKRVYIQSATWSLNMAPGRPPYALSPYSGNEWNMSKVYMLLLPSLISVFAQLHTPFPTGLSQGTHTHVYIYTQLEMRYSRTYALTKTKHTNNNQSRWRKCMVKRGGDIRATSKKKKSHPSIDRSPPFFFPSWQWRYKIHDRKERGTQIVCNRVVWNPFYPFPGLV